MTDDTDSLEARALHLLATFETINKRDIPERFGQLVDCLFGAIRQQIRLGREIDTMKRRGVLDVDVFVDEARKIAVEQ